MNTSVKNYTKSELFTLANKIRSSKGISQKEAFAMAKKQLETPVFDFSDFIHNWKNYTTRTGLKVKYICQTRGQIMVHVYSRQGSYMDSDIKYNMDGRRWNTDSMYDLVKVA